MDFRIWPKLFWFLCLGLLIGSGEAVYAASEQEEEQFFRPSSLPILNTRPFPSAFFHPFYEKPPESIHLPASLMKTPEDTILNYTSILRHAEHFTPETGGGGCGTVGHANWPYPVAYQFLTSAYRERLPYAAYLKQLAGIGHLNLIKMHPVRNDKKDGSLRYFVELETIEGSKKGVTNFAYYYGYLYLKRQGNRYLIDDSKLVGEDFLCAPYHGWSWSGEGVVGVKFGHWCKLVKNIQPAKRDGYIKTIDADGTNGNQYRFQFITLTNGTDVEIAQFQRKPGATWQPIHINPEDCLQKKPLPKRSS